MRLLALLVILLPISAFAMELADSTHIFQAPGAIVLHPVPGIDYAYDQHGNSATVYETPLPGLSWSSQRNQYGQITSQGYVWEPIPPPQPLEVPVSPWRGRERMPMDSLLDR